jgi:pilus assembly protein HofO
VVRPASQQAASLSVDHERAITAIGTLWVSTRQHHAGEVEHESAAVPPFPPLDFQTAGTQLIRWQPDANGGELTLDAEWVNIPVLFNRLAQRGMGVMTFSVEPGKSRLVVVVRVESLHAK